MQRTGSRFSTQNLARVTSRHPWTTLGIWVMVLAAALVLNVQFGADALTSDFGFTNDAQSQTARDLVEERFGTSFQEVLVVKSETLVVEDEAFRQRVESAYDLIVESGGIEPIQPHFYLTGDEQLSPVTVALSSFRSPSPGSWTQPSRLSSRSWKR